MSMPERMKPALSRDSGRSVEVRIPPYAAVQCGVGDPGPTHTRGTPPNVVETDALTFLRLATGRTSWADALASGAVDAAPIRADLVAQRYVRDYGAQGAHVLAHPPFRDDGGNVYVPETALADPGKAAALRIFAHYWGRAQAWINTHPEELARGYYAGKRGLPIDDATADEPGRWFAEVTALRAWATGLWVNRLAATAEVLQLRTALTRELS